MELCVIWHKIKYFKKGAEPPAGVTIYRVPFGKMTYKEFLASKRFVLESSGFDIDKTELNPMLYEFQKDIVRWALKKGKACIFADCGLGKTPMRYRGHTRYISIPAEKY